jgi:serine/threonine protein kinase/Tol biopolymer transport system component
MPISVGDRLGPYEILVPIGAGGMGEVWKATDTRLDRIVAVKVSQENFSERFDREARAIAALNHPHICTLHDVGPNYLVMEYVEGTPLVSKERGPLGTEEALRYAGQICEALDHAHRRGITHRDLKPSNILLTKQGIKLLDFGLAKLRPSPLKETDSTLTQALSKPLTRDGQILGTLQYMSPEQLQGREADASSDLFSFGCVLYEMLTAKRAFDGQSAASVIAAILERPAPSVSSVAPAALDRVQRCLAKDPDQRFQNALDLKAALEWAMLPLGESAASLPAPQPRLGYASWIAAAVLALALAGVSWIAYRATRPAPLKPLVRLDVDLGPDVSLNSQLGANTILSPDGTRLVYVSQGKLFTRRLDQSKAAELAGTDGAYAPFFSPDGQWVAFFTANKLKKVSVDGGAVIALCDATSPMGGSWGDDGNIVAALTTTGVLSRVPSSGGVPAPVTELGQGEVTHRWPQILPGSKAVLFTANRSAVGFDGGNIEVLSPVSNRTKILVRGATFGRYLAVSKEAGYLVYVSRGALFAVPFDPEKLELRGTPTPVLEQVSYSSQSGSAQFDFSRDRTLVYLSGQPGTGMVTIQWLNGDKMQPLLAKPGSYMRPRLSPDGQRLAMDIGEGSGSDFWIYDWQRDTMTRLTFGGSSFYEPIWSPDARYIVGTASEGLIWMRADGAGKPQPLTRSKNIQYAWSFSPDGKRLAYNEAAPNGFAIWTLPLESTSSGLRAGKPEPFLQAPLQERQAMFSPDGRWMAYASNESGASQVYVRAFPDKGGKWQISSAGGATPEWSRNGRELFFRTLDNRIMVTNYTVQGDSFVAGKPQVWSEKQLADFGPLVPNYDLAPDGKRIAALMPAEGQEEQKAQNHVIFLENFFDELRRKVPERN